MIEVKRTFYTVEVEDGTRFLLTDCGQEGLGRMS